VYDRDMRYAQRGGYTPAEQQRREWLRLEVGGRFARGDGVSEIGGTCGSPKGRSAGGGGPGGGRSRGAEVRGPVSRERLSPQQFARLEAELRKGPLAHGFAGDQRWTLGRIKTLIGKLFHVGYTVEGIWKLMRRHGLVLPGPGVLLPRWPLRACCYRSGSADAARSRATDQG
jgi:winged helix-turn-helix protein